MQPYEFLARWDDKTGAFKGAHVQWSDGSVQPINDAGGYPLADILQTMQVDALAAVDDANLALTAKQAELDQSQQARQSAESERDALIVQRDQLLEQIAAMQQQADSSAVEAHKFLLELEGRGLLDDIEAFVAQQSRGVQLAFARAPTFSQDSVMMRAAQAQMGMPDALYDAIFTSARARVT